MKLIINGRKLELTDAIKQYVKEKTSRIEQHFDFVREIHVHLSVEKNKRIAESHLAEATVQVNGAVFRFEEQSEHLYASIDLLVDKIERGLRRHKSKMLLRSKSGRSNGGESIRHAGKEEEPLLASDEELEADYYPLIIAEEDGATDDAEVKETTSVAGES